MSQFIVDEVNKSIHNFDKINQKMCKASSVDENKIIVLFNEDELRDLLVNKDYNGCPFCLKKYYLERKFLVKKWPLLHR